MDLSKAFDFKPEMVNYHYIAFISSFVLWQGPNGWDWRHESMEKLFIGVLS